MPTSFRPSPFWTAWLSAAAAGVVAFGLVLVLAPSLARQGFSLLLYGTPGRIDGFGPEAARYIALAHAVIGGVMAGWGSALFYGIRTLFAKGSPVAWKLIALSVCAWFVPDTAYSLLSGFWRNALLNTVFLALFAAPLWATRGMRRHRD
jgi:hypothetical protein